MSTYKPGIRTQNALIKSAKILFYDKGYVHTSVKDICEMADVPNNSITYHFKGKDKLALIIYNEFVQKAFSLPEEKFGNAFLETKVYLKIMLPYMIWWHIIFDEPNIRRFVKELYVNRIAQQDFLTNSAMGDMAGSFFSLYEKAFDVQFDEEYHNILRSAFLGVESEFLIGYGSYFHDQNKILRYLFKTRLSNFGVTDEQFHDMYEECTALFHELDLNIDDYRGFDYKG